MSIQQRPRVSVLGAGSWGTALAVLATARADTILWARDPDQAHRIAHDHANPRYLPDITLPATLSATADFQQALDHVCNHHADDNLIILGVPVVGLSALCQQLAQALTARPPQGKLSIVWTCKGFQPDSGLLPEQIAGQSLASLPNVGLGVLSGPSFAREVAQGLPVALTVATQQPWVAHAAIQALHGSNARIYSSTDIVGVEVGGALKNVMAIACGISDGLKLGTNARAALITRGLAEMQRLGQALGGQASTFAGLTGLGDLVLTATGDLSRNRQVGIALAQGQKLDDILAGGLTAEGVRCARAVLALGHQHRIDMPITEAVCKVLFNNLAPAQAVTELLTREAGPE